MTTIVASFVLILFVMAGMAIGVLFGRQPIKGSCGGLNKAGVDESCELCGGNPNKCEESRA
ncbi:hypothetical protein GCM10011403_12230 [Pseudohongiella nitratireducens]|uniref:ApbE family protein n=1 Tax=Pseudohongiella nitratireducens TaxID=1768907 RepID=A0A917LTV0_9GAMM|nr:(Na+)-NQR maturation NqrM [Pseudohongiella nitratireducens]MDF1624031.1 (Na+)-NQR maturation NqrM [Pseudohongiella nitratireducens]GGG56610.1 hypothetical protein GCM10011403_12230 [Pseudohongiella nitratireducens]|tara:strand:- start:3015 stop:3197 length:183 start_codon:yes stop_codon:yes gene_type:complete